MNIELIVDSVTVYVQFQNATGVGCLLSNGPIPGTGYGRRREVTRKQLQMIGYGYRSVDSGESVELRDGAAAVVDVATSVDDGDVLTTTKATRAVTTR